MKNRKHVTVGFVGYPNTGKSSVINAIKAKKVCVAAPIPGETKVWQYVALTNRIYLLDCPGIVAASSHEDGHNNVGKVLKGVVRAEKLENPQDYIYAIVERVGRNKMNEHYKLEGEDADWTTAEELLEILARKQGRLKKGGETDIGICAKRIIYDFQRGVIPHFVYPPKMSQLPPLVKPKPRGGETELIDDST